MDQIFASKDSTISTGYYYRRMLIFGLMTVSEKRNNIGVKETISVSRLFFDYVKFRFINCQAQSIQMP